ncbi:TPA: hypothetical protein DIC20_01545 [Candidatus Dependentiae bacterium]|nr:hypothetical protein [Candidatus Dependentiae bacterium]HCU00370.1 hypothetical protein [Candidatus Dependentiae bacterium]
MPFDAFFDTQMKSAAQNLLGANGVCGCLRSIVKFLKYFLSRSSCRARRSLGEVASEFRT